MLVPIVTILVMAGAATLLYKGAEMEHMAGWPWVVLSLLAWGVAQLYFGWGLLVVVGLQVGLFVLLGIVIFLRRKKPEIIK